VGRLPAAGALVGASAVGGAAGALVGASAVGGAAGSAVGGAAVGAGALVAAPPVGWLPQAASSAIRSSVPIHGLRMLVSFRQVASHRSQVTDRHHLAACDLLLAAWDTKKIADLGLVSDRIVLALPYAGITQVRFEGSAA